MSGKGKRKGKGKSKPKERETEFDKNYVDAVCLAYDIFIESASQFGVNDNCLAVWEGPKNDYGPRVHFEYICRTVITDQLKLRYLWNKWIEHHVKNDKFESFEPVGQVLEKMIEFLASGKSKTEIDFVEMSLAAVCELILYLHAKGKCLYLKQLAEHWFECYFRKAKKQFEKEGGFGAVCWRGYYNVRDYPPDFIKSCIKDLEYNDYKKSVQNELLADEFVESSINYIKKNQKHCPEPSFKLRSKFAAKLFPSTFSISLFHFHLHFHFFVSTPEPEKASGNWKSTPRSNAAHTSSDSCRAAIVKPTFKSVQEKVEDSEVNKLLNPGLGVPTPEELHGPLLAGDAVQSQNLPEESAQDLSKSTKRQSYLDRKRTKEASSRSRVEQGHGQLSLNSSTCTDSTQCYERHGTKPKVPVQNTGSTGLQPDKSIPSSRVEQGHGQLSLNSSIATDTGQSYERHGAKPKVPVQNTETSGLQTGEPSLCSRVEQDFGLLSLGFSEKKQRREKKTIPSISKYLT